MKDHKNITEQDIEYAIEQASMHYKIYLFGGNRNLTKKLESKYPGIQCYHSDRKGNCDSMVSHADLILFKTDCFCHVMFKKVRRLADVKRIPYRYVKPVTALPLLEKEIYENIEMAGLKENK